MPKKWQVDLEDYRERYGFNPSVAATPDDHNMLICMGLLAIAERLEVIAEAAVKRANPLLRVKDPLAGVRSRRGPVEDKIGGTDPD